MSLIKVLDVTDLPPGEMVDKEVEGLPPLAVYNIDGEFFATSALCTHEVALLTDGYLDGDIVECPMHGGCFNVRTGEATQFPCTTPLRTFEVEVSDGAVFVKSS